MSQKRGVLASQWTAPPPTVWGRASTAPVIGVACGEDLNTLGSAVSSGKENPRSIFSSSFENTVPGRSDSRSVK